MTKVSVVTPAYNADEHLKETIRSVAQQTHEEYEHIIVDDGSTDTTKNILSEAQAEHDHLRVIHHEENQGIVTTRNDAFKAAEGEYYAVLDADDTMRSDRLEKQAAFLDEHDEHGLVGSHITIINKNSERTGRRTYPVSDEAIREALPRYAPFAQPAVMIRSAVIEDVGDYDERWDRSQDYDLWFRIADKYKVHNLDEQLTSYRVYGDQGKSTHLKRTLQNTLRIQREHLFTEEYFSPYNLAYHAAHYPLFLLPNAVILWLFKQLRYNE
jgi:glycosyltransferase involved in cell wall biosynthesis